MSNEPEGTSGPKQNPCDEMEEFKPTPFVMVIFGGTGDLSQRKLLPTLYHLYADEKRILNFSIVGVGSRPFSDEAYRTLVCEVLNQNSLGDIKTEELNQFLKHLYYQQQDLTADSDLSGLIRRAEELSPTHDRAANIIFYLAVPPPLVTVIIEKIKKCDEQQCYLNRKVIVEKPFGVDHDSAVELNRQLREVFQEKQIYRIDHYLAKDTVQSLTFFRFGNSIFEPLWNHQYIDHVQITVAEKAGIEHRGRFYEEAGIVRDIVQNHMIQLIGLVAMEPPAGFEAEQIRDEKVKVFRSLKVLKADEIEKWMVRGQYGPGPAGAQQGKSYRQEEHVAPDSSVPTFFAGKFFVENWRWSGVPFYVRTGKSLALQKTEIIVQFKQPPLKLFGRLCDSVVPNSLIFYIQPAPGIDLRLNIKSPGMANYLKTVDLEFDYNRHTKGPEHSPYERLLVDCIKGDLTLFARQDEVEAMWDVVDPIILYWQEHPASDFPNYPTGSWGPGSAELLIKADGRSWY